MSKRFDNKSSRIGLLNATGKLAGGRLSLGGCVKRPLADNLGEKKAHCGKNTENTSHKGAVEGKHDGCADEGGRGNNNLEKTALEHFGDFIQIICGTRDGVAGAVCIKV